MATSVTHSTAADGSFSAGGITAWDAAHTVAGAENVLAYAALTVTTANVDGVVNTLHYATIAGLTADRTWTLPATAAVGDRCGLFIADGDTAFELLITATSGDTLNGVSGGAEWSRLFIINESVIMRCIVANTTWIVEQDGRIPIQVLMRLSTDAAGESGATFTVPTAVSGVWTADTNVGGCASVADSRAYARRAGNFEISGSALPVSTIGADKYFGCRIYKTGTTNIITTFTQYVPAAVTSSGAKTIADCVPLAVDDYAQFTYVSQEGTRGLDAQGAPWQASYLSLKEIL